MVTMFKGVKRITMAGKRPNKVKSMGQRGHNKRPGLVDYDKDLGFHPERSEGRVTSSDEVGASGNQ